MFALPTLPPRLRECRCTATCVMQRPETSGIRSTPYMCGGQAGESVIVSQGYDVIVQLREDKRHLINHALAES